MPGTTPQNALPYMTDGDPLSTVAAKMQDLAQRTSQVAGLAGGVVVSVNNSDGGQATLTFPAGFFPTVPTVVATAENGNYYAVTTARTTAGVNILVRHRTAAVSTVAVYVNWIARVPS